MADVVVNLETDNSEELVNQGIKAFNLCDFNTAVMALGRAVELLAAEHGDKHDSLGVAYFYYGKALLELYRAEAEPLGDAVPRELDSDSGDEAPAEESSNPDGNEPIPAADKPSENSANGSGLSDNNGASTTVTNGDANIEVGSSSNVQDETLTDEPAEEEPTDLQVAWEVLELAKMIFDGRGDPGKQELAETLILLGEVSLESENFTSAIDDMKSGLEIQKTLVADDSRTLAETYYKLGIALSTNNQIDEATENFNTSLDILKNKINKLKENAEANDEEIREIEHLIPEIEEKVMDMKNFKEETAKSLMAALQAKPESSGPFDAGSSTSTVNNITHLIKRKRKSGEDGDEDKPPKKVSE